MQQPKTNVGVTVEDRPQRHLGSHIMNRLILGLAGFASLAAAMPAFTTAANAQSVGQREANQQHRIQQGVASGHLTPGETRHMETREARLTTRTDRMRARHDGHLSGRDRVALQHQENRDSRAVYRTKHNGPVD